MELQFEFEELPLVLTHDSFSTALVDGYAEVTMFKDGGWRLGVIKVQVSKSEPVRDEDGVLRLVHHLPKFIIPPAFVEHAIRVMLREDALWKGLVQQQVDEELHAMKTAQREYEPEVM